MGHSCSSCVDDQWLCFQSLMDYGFYYTAVFLVCLEIWTCCSLMLSSRQWVSWVPLLLCICYMDWYTILEMTIVRWQKQFECCILLLLCICLMNWCAIGEISYYASSLVMMQLSVDADVYVFSFHNNVLIFLLKVHILTIYPLKIYNLKIYILKICSAKFPETFYINNDMKTIEIPLSKKSPFKNLSFKNLCSKKLSIQNFDKIVDENFGKFESKKFDSKNISENLCKIVDSNNFLNNFDKNPHNFLSDNLKVYLLACMYLKILIELYPYAIEQIYLHNINDNSKDYKIYHINYYLKIIDANENLFLKNYPEYNKK